MNHASLARDGTNYSRYFVKCHTAPLPSMRARVAKLKSNATKRNRDSSPARAADKLYSIRDIIDEKVERGNLYYRIDWADDSETGEKYSPTWVSLSMSARLHPRWGG